MPSPFVELEVGERVVKVTNPDKVLFPDAGHTKRDLVDYYLSVGDGIVRALRERPTQLRRFPDGIAGEQIYQKRVPEQRPDWIEVARVTFPSGRHADELCVTEVAQVVWGANLAVIDYHPWPSRRADVDKPDELRIDVDPQPEMIAICGRDEAAVRAAAGQLGWQGYEWPSMWYYIYLQGQPLFRFPIPTGQPEVASAWVNSNGFRNRWKYADQLMFLTPGNGYQIESDPLPVAQRLRLTTADAVIDHYSRLLLGITLDAQRRQILTDLLVNPGSGLYDPADAGQTWRLREMISNMLGFPEFNKQ